MQKSLYASLFVILFALLALPLAAQDEHHGDGHAEGGDHEGYDPVETVMEHISDANEFHIWKGVHLPLPVIVYAPGEGPGKGLKTFLSSKFDHGHAAVYGYVLNHGRVNRVADDDFPQGEEVPIDGIVRRDVETAEGKTETKYFVEYEGQAYELDPPSTLDGGFLGGGITSFYDFSITKVVFSMILASILLVWLFLAVRRGYRRNEGQAPSGIQSFMEPFFTFIREEITIPMIGEKHYEKYQPFIMTLFFFVLFCNLFGLVPFFPGSANITGNLAVTLVLAVFTFIVTNVNGNADYWKHVFWMPGIPAWVKIILTPVEILSLFIKPFSLMIRLFANITAGHIIILSLIGLIFLFGNNGESLGGAAVGGVVGMLFTAFMNLIELLVAFLQAFIFAILSASYIGAAVDDSHHGEAHDHEVEAAHQAGTTV